MRLLFSIIAAATVLHLSVGTLQAQDAPAQITLPGLPSSIEEFESQRDSVANTPEGGAAMTIVALIVLSENESLGMQMLTVALDRSNLQKGSVYKGFAPHRSLNYHLGRVRSWKNGVYSYVQGATPQNGYQLPNGELVFRFSRNRYSETSPENIKVFVESSGASSPRPVRLIKNNRGVWKAKELSSLFLGVAAPADNTDDAL